MSRTMLAATVLATIAAAACYNPSLDGKGKFLCGEQTQLCPEGFVCKDAVCVRKGTDPGRDSGPLPEDMDTPKEDVAPPLPEECQLSEEGEIAKCRTGGQFGAAVLDETLAVTFTQNSLLLSAVKLPGQKWTTRKPLTSIQSSGYSAIHLSPNRSFVGYRTPDEGLVVISSNYPKPDSGTKSTVIGNGIGPYISVAPHAENDALIWVAYQATTGSETSPHRIARVALVNRYTAEIASSTDIKESQAEPLSGAFVTIATSKQGGTHLAYLSVVNNLKTVKVFQSSFEKQWTTPILIGEQISLPTESRGVTVAVDNRAHYVYPSNKGLIHGDDPIMFEPPIEGQAGKPSLALGDWKVVGFTNMNLGALGYQKARGPWRSLNLDGAPGETTQIQVLTSAPNRYEVFYRKELEADAILYHRTLTCGDMAPPQPTEPPVEPNQGE